MSPRADLDPGAGGHVRCGDAGPSQHGCPGVRRRVPGWHVNSRHGGERCHRRLSSRLFLTLVGIACLFAIAQNNGTIDWLVDLAVRAVRGRIWAIPWIMFLIAAVLTSVGAVSPGAVAIVAPIALGFAFQYKISPLMMGLLVIHGAGRWFLPDQHLRVASRPRLSRAPVCRSIRSSSSWPASPLTSWCRSLCLSCWAATS